jgi:hypothetical protein
MALSFCVTTRDSRLVSAPTRHLSLLEWWCAQDEHAGFMKMARPKALSHLVDLINAVRGRAPAPPILVRP